MKGVFRQRPTLPPYSVTFDVNIIFHYLATLPALGKIYLKRLSFRLATILCILSGQKSQTLGSLSLDCMLSLEDRIIFPINKLLNQSRPGYHQQSLELLVYYGESANLCLVANIKQYIELTKPLRNSEDQLFISYTPPQKAVKSKSVACWVLSFLQECGIDTNIFGTHSTRCVST